MVSHSIGDASEMASTAEASAALSTLRRVFVAGGAPSGIGGADWRAAFAPMGILHIMTPPARPLNVTLRGDGCLLYSKEEQVRHSYKAIPVMSEGTVMALFLRQKMTPKLPMALVSDAAAVSFVHARPELADVWDHLLTLDVASATTALKAAQMPIPLSKFWCIWKLAGLLMSPFEHTLYVDADVMVLNPSFASDLLQNSLRLHDMAMPVDTNRPGKGDPTMKSARADTTGFFAQTRYHAAPSGEQPELMEPPMFARGFPPFCTGIIAYARKTEVRRLLEHAGARLIGQLNRNDATDASIAVRQTEQEMMWFELALGPRSKQPRLLVLPEEYYCPAAAGSRQSLVYSEQLAARKSPFWGVVGHTREKGAAKRTLKTQMATITNDRYLSGGSKDCHATHLHLSNYRLKVFNITDSFSGRRAHQVQWALFRMDRELFCWQRAHRGVLPPCQILGANKLVYPEGGGSGSGGGSAASRVRRGVWSRGRAGESMERSRGTQRMHREKAVAHCEFVDDRAADTQHT